MTNPNPTLAFDPALEAERAKFRQHQALLDRTERIAHIGHFEWSYELGRLLSCSEEYARIHDMSVPEIMLAHNSWQGVLQQLHPDDRDAFEKSELDLRHEKSIDIEFRIILKTGHVRHIRKFAIEVTDENGVEIGTFGILQDVSERMRYERDLEYRDELARQIEAITDIGHFIYDEENQRYVYMSEGCASIYGNTPAYYMAQVESLEADLADIVEEDRERVAEEYASYRETSEDCALEYRIVRADGAIRWLRELTRAKLTKNGRVVQTLGVVQDITEQKKTEEEIIKAKETLEQQVIERTRELANTVKQLQEEIEEREKIAAELDFLANHDALTGLPSLRLCKDRLNHSLAEARRNRQTSAVMFLDLDGFKVVNDQYGHEFGDQLLKVTSQRIRAEIRETDTVARIGGDEFVIILSSLPENEIAERIASSLIEQLSRPVFIEDISVAISASIGISIYPQNGTTAEELIRSADKAMYGIKHQGKNDFGFVTLENTKSPV